MSVIQKHKTFYIEICPDEIIIYTKYAASSYPYWLGKNRSVMNKACAFLISHPPKDMVEFLDFVSKFELFGSVSMKKANADFFVDEKIVDKNKIFW